jgi:hypothetical protein
LAWILQKRRQMKTSYKVLLVCLLGAISFSQAEAKGRCHYLFSHYELGQRYELNSTWIEPQKQWVTGEWEQFGSARAKGYGGRPYIDFFTTKDLSYVTVESEPFEMATAYWPHKSGRAQGGYYIRLQETKEIVAMIEQSFGWSWVLTHKFLSSDTSPKSMVANTLHGAMGTFFDSIGRYEHTLLDGRRTPEIFGTLLAIEKTKGVKSVLRKMLDRRIDVMYLAMAVVNYRDFRPYNTVDIYKVTAHPTFGVEIKPVDHAGSSRDPEFINLLLNDPSKLWVAHYGEQANALKDRAGKQFTWDF